MAQGTISRDIQDELLKKRVRRRDSGYKAGTRIPYPLQPSQESFVYDNWNHMFLGNLVRNITMHTFETPPMRVLDLGCGSGLWVIEAAKKWPSAVFVGFDILRCQPNLRNSELGLTDFAPRISWVHGDILEPLPFADEEFDFVRICGLGLAIPEDEWQYVFEECARISVPGGVIELVEEDLIFPTGVAPQDEGIRSPVSLVPSLSPTIPAGGGESTSNLSYSSSPSTLLSDPLAITTARPPEPTSSVDSDTSNRSIPSIRRDSDRFRDPHDHSSLARAWEEMLQHRFIAQNVLSILPFYLSTYFHEIQMMPTLHFLIPPSSSTVGKDIHQHFDETKDDLADLYLDLQTHGTRWSGERSDAAPARAKPSRSATVSSWASIHLARSVQTIRACKEPLWQEFKEGRGFRKIPEHDVNILREDFEAAWANWESDMKDRMSMRAKLHESLAWVDASGSDHPDWKVWREHSGKMEISDSTSSHIGPENLCRSLRGFVGWKPKNP
ncbi:hypothetical protein WOLCODRAFT_137757 [Wolfiporia cocos MD-104 SS10]|uniref:Methyltransferase domain-containing protein n=1 Tax=Wolfiporia cocos (strain MD-104) TaxID=742152 RepID=A0A2H3JJ41_WOLCO|nr:hypothetical protein WOLCODRAFT_137757 [Wolfiporia cocos MD-104 SS10]